MKKLLTIPIILFILLSGCHIVIEEPYYSANRYVGSYEVDEWSDSFGAQTFYDIYIHKDPYDDNIIYIDNFYNVDIEVFARVTGSKVRIPLQRVGYYEIEGAGTLIGHELNLDFSVVDIYDHYRTVDYCNALCLKY